MDKKSFAGLGALVAAGIGSVCCVGPVVLAGLGFGAGALGFAREFGVLHMPMMILAFLLLGGAFYFNYQKKRGVSAEENCCESSPSNKSKKEALLWVATALTVFLFLFPYIF